MDEIGVPDLSIKTVKQVDFEIKFKRYDFFQEASDLMKNQNPALWKLYYCPIQFMEVYCSINNENEINEMRKMLSFLKKKSLLLRPVSIIIFYAFYLEAEEQNLKLPILSEEVIDKETEYCLEKYSSYYKKNFENEKYSCIIRDSFKKSILGKIEKMSSLEKLVKEIKIIFPHPSMVSPIAYEVVAFLKWQEEVDRLEESLLKE